MILQKNVLHYYVDLLRMQDGETRVSEESKSSIDALHNIIRTMKYARQNMICGEDFNNLNWGNIPFNGINWSDGGNFPCSFNGCFINEWNFQSGHSYGITSVEWSEQGYYLTSAKDNSTIIWDEHTHLMLQKLNEPNKVYYSCFTADGKYCLTCSSKTIKLWDVTLGTCIKTLECHEYRVNCIVVSPTEKCFVVCCSNKKLKVYQIATNDCIANYSFAAKIYSMAISPSGKHLLIGQGNGTTLIIDILTGRVLQRLSGHLGKVRGVAYFPNGSLCCTCSDDRASKIWSITTGKCIKTLSGHSDAINSIAVSRDAHYCTTVSSDNNAKVWNTDNGECLFTLEGHTNAVTSASFSPDGKHLLTGSKDGEVRVWDMLTGAGSKILRPNSVRISSSTFSNSRHYFLTCTWKTLNLWNLQERRLIKSIPGHYSRIGCIAFSSDDSIFVSGSNDTNVKVWHTETGECLQTFKGHHNRVSAITISDDSMYCLTGSMSEAIIWNIKNGSIVRNLTGHEGWVTCLIFSRDRKYCITGDSKGVIKLWDVESGLLLTDYLGHSGAIRALSMSLNQDLLLSASDDKTAMLWDIRTGKCQTILKGHTNTVTFTKFIDNEQYCLTCSKDRTVRIWDFQNSKEISKLNVIASDVAQNIYWIFPYYLTYHDSSFYVGLVKCDYSNKNAEIEYIYRYLNIDGLFIQKCSFIRASEKNSVKNQSTVV